MLSNMHMRMAALALVLVAGASAAFPSRALAQDAGRSEAVPVTTLQKMSAAENAAADRDAIMRDSLAGLRWMATGHRDWSRYVHPAQCKAAIEVAQHRTTTRTKWVHPPNRDDTLSTVARETGRACIAKFSPATTDVRDLPEFRAVALALNDVPLAKAIIDAQLAKAKTPDEKGSVIADALLDIVERYPDQMALADALVERISTFGPQARWWRVVALGELPMSAVFDTARRVQIDRQMSAAYAALSHDERMKSGTGLLALGTTWMQVQEYRRLSPDSVCRAQRQAALAVGTDSVQGNTGPMFAALIDATCPQFMQGVGKPVAAFPNGDWFVQGDTVAQQTLGYPRHGHVTLLINAPIGAGRPTPQLAIARRLYQKYAGDGLDIVMVHRRKGFIWGSNRLAPEAETQLMRWYDHEYLKLPFPIAIYDSSATNFPEAMLVGRDGRLYAATAAAGPEDEVGLDAFIRQALEARENH